MVGMNEESFIYQAVHAKGPPSANSEQISQNQSSTAPVRLFWLDPAPITSAVNAKSGYAFKEAAGNTIITQLESIAR